MTHVGSTVQPLMDDEVRHDSRPALDLTDAQSVDASAVRAQAFRDGQAASLAGRPWQSQHLEGKDWEAKRAGIEIDLELRLPGTLVSTLPEP